MNDIPCLLQPADSKRVADALLAKIEEADFDIALPVERALSTDRRTSFAEELIDACGGAVRSAVEHCIGSKEMADVVASAIRDGMDNREE